MDDEPAVRYFVKMALSREGWNVLEAGNAIDAISLCERHHEAVQLLVTDLLLPEMSGRRLAETLLLKRPEMKVLYISGHTEESAVEAGILEAGASFLGKPFTVTGFTEKVVATMRGTGQG